MKRSLLLIAVLLLVVCVRAENEVVSNLKTGEDAINYAKKLFNEKKYTEAIDVVDRGIVLNNNLQDSIWAELLYRKGICYNYLYQNDNAMLTFREVYDGYKPKQRNDNLLNRICDFFCQLYDNGSYRHPSNNYEIYGKMFDECAKHLVRNHFYLNNAKNYYLFSLKEQYAQVIDKEKLDSIWNNEVSPFLKTNEISDAIYYEIKGEFYEMWPYTRPVETKFESIVAYSSLPYNDWNHHELARLFNEIGYYSAAANNYAQSIVDFFHEDKNGEITLHPDIDEYYYIGCLQKLNKKSKIIEICDKIMNDSRFCKLPQYEQEQILQYKKDAEGINTEQIKQDVSNNPDNNTEYIDITNLKLDEIYQQEDWMIKFYEADKINSEIFKTLILELPHDVYYPVKEFFIYLWNKDEYKLIISIYETLAVNNKFLNLIDERDYWHHANHAPHSFVFYDIVSWSYYKEGDYENAIKIKKHVINLVRTDCYENWDTYECVFGDKSQRMELLYIAVDENQIANRYIKTEIDQYLDLGRMYLLTKDYQNAFQTLRYAYELNEELLEYSLFGETDKKQRVWYEHRAKILEIYMELIDYVDLYPPFADFVMELSSTIKGFMMNYNKQTKNIIKLNDDNSELQMVVSLMQNTEIILERSYNSYSFTPWLENDLDVLYNQIDNHEANRDVFDMHIRRYIDTKSIIRNSFVKVDDIKNELDSDDIYVDFMLYTSDSDSAIIERNFSKKMYVNGETFDSFTVSTANSKIYVGIIRNDWEHAKVICLGRLSDILSEKEKDIIDLVYIPNNSVENFLNLYKNPTITDFIWEKIISEANISEGENIYFIPNGIFNNVALESLAIDEDTIMSDKYNMYRLSSVRELNKKNSFYSKSDKCVAFGDVEYSSYKFDDIKNSNYPEIFDRRFLSNIVASKNELNLLKSIIPNIDIKRGYNATEYEFSKLNNSSPEMLFFSTHGFNYVDYFLSNDERTYLYGDPKRRNIEDLSDITKSMYCSGLYLGLTKIDVYDFSTRFASNGMLTAKEVSLYDLSNTKLVMLSACSSGIGTLEKEGVYGLQRGFKLAGVESIIATLWDVDEDASYMLMSEFLKNYTSGMSKHESLRKAQIKVRNYRSDDLFNPISYANPFYWAGFILID